jgi:N utilization substance protein B
LHAAIFELLYKPQTSVNIIINEYLNAAEAFVDSKQKKFLNALLDKISKKIRNSNE